MQVRARQCLTSPTPVDVVLVNGLAAVRDLVIRMRHLKSFRVSEWLEDHLWLSLRGWRRLVQSCVSHGVRYIMHGHSHSSRIVGFEGSKLVALGQGKTGECGEFSLYDLPEEGVGSRRILRAGDKKIDHHTRRLIVPDFIVSEWPEGV